MDLGVAGGVNLDCKEESMPSSEVVYNVMIERVAVDWAVGLRKGWANLNVLSLKKEGVIERQSLM